MKKGFPYMLPTTEQQGWLHEQFAKHVPIMKPNPCVQLYGPGPEGATCKRCLHLVRKEMSRTYLKCAMRTNTNGPGTDHKAGWPACGMYKEHGDPKEAA